MKPWRVEGHEFHEDVSDSSMCMCGRPAMNHAMESHAAFALAQADEIDRLRAELADAREYASPSLTAHIVALTRRAELAEARLAAVIALCDSLDGKTWRPATGRTVGEEVRAAAAGNPT